MEISIPRVSLVMLLGPAGSGKSTFARQHFKPTEVLSADFFRGLVSDNENDQRVSGDAFDALRFVAAKRLARRRLTVIDATNIRRSLRWPLVKLAHAHRAHLAAIVFQLPEELCVARDAQRSERRVGAVVIHRQSDALRHAIERLPEEGFGDVYLLTTPEEVAAVTIERRSMTSDRPRRLGG